MPRMRFACEGPLVGARRTGTGVRIHLAAQVRNLRQRVLGRAFTPVPGNRVLADAEAVGVAVVHQKQ